MMRQGHYKDDRLPKGYTVYYNAFDEWVVCDSSGRVARVDEQGNAVQASRRMDGAVVNWQMLKRSDSQVSN